MCCNCWWTGRANPPRAPSSPRLWPTPMACRHTADRTVRIQAGNRPVPTAAPLHRRIVPVCDGHSPARLLRLQPDFDFQPTDRAIGLVERVGDGADVHSPKHGLINQRPRSARSAHTIHHCPIHTRRADLEWLIVAQQEQHSRMAAGMRLRRRQLPRRRGYTVRSW